MLQTELIGDVLTAVMFPVEQELVIERMKALTARELFVVEPNDMIRY